MEFITFLLQKIISNLSSNKLSFIIKDLFNSENIHLNIACAQCAEAVIIQEEPVVKGFLSEFRKIEK